MTTSRLPLVIGPVGLTEQIQPGDALAGRVNVLWFGAKGDGATDDTAAIVAALTTGLSVVFPSGYTFKITSPLSLSADGQEITGGGKILAVGTFVAVFTANGLNNVLIDGLIIECGNVAAEDGINILNCTGAKVTRCTISKHGGAGVELMNSSYCVVDNNTFLSMAVDPTWGMPSGSDVYLGGQNSHCSITNNMMHSAGGYGIQLATTAAAQQANYNVFSGNIIDGYNSYGIVIYRLSDGGDGQQIFGTIIEGNEILNISGARSVNPAIPLVLDFGAGIYVQGAEKTVVDGNYLTNCNIDTNTETLSPGAIGISNAGDCSISGNSIHDTVYGGIWLNDSNNGGATVGGITITGNNIVNCGNRGINVAVKSRIVITGNLIDTATHGILWNVASATTDAVVNGNRIANFAQIGIGLDLVTRAIVANNEIVTTGVEGITFVACVDCAAGGNIVKGATVRGILVDGSCSGAMSVQSNTLKSCAIAALIQSPALVANNIFDGNTTDYSGTYAPLGVIVDSATPSVNLRTAFTSTPVGARTFTNFLGGSVSQVITVLAGNGNTTVQHNANIVLHGGADYAMSANNTLTMLCVDAVAPLWVELARA